MLEKRKINQREIKINSKLLTFLILSGIFSEKHAYPATPTAIKSYPVKQLKQHTELSRRKLQKLKGKKTRKNRGKKRR